MTTAAPRAYHLELSRGLVGFSAEITRTGPENILQLALGRPIEEAIKLAGLLFPICPRAHRAAALNAAEQALAVELPAGQAAAREALVLAEAIAGCVWRGGLGWTRLLGDAPLADPVKAARDASTALEPSLFTGPWARLGGAEIRVNRGALIDALKALSSSVHCIAQMESRLLKAADGHFKDTEVSTCGALGDRLVKSIADPTNTCGEETPRSLSYEPQKGIRPTDWFAAQLDHAFALLSLLRDRLSEVEDAAPAEAPRHGSGHGLGLAMTARGRLRHVVSIENGHISKWRAAAPTDWNFAPGGPLIHYISDLQTDRPDETARWMIAALDPCAPCTHALQPEAAHA